MAEQSFGGPYVQVAAICATPLIEREGFLSVIRIQDRIQVAGMTDQMRPQPLSNLTLVLVLKAGELRGKYAIRITPVTPSGTSLPHIEIPALFEGEERGVASAIPLMLAVEEEGLYWFEVTLESTVLTRIPLRVLYQKVPPGFGNPFQPPQTG